MAPVEASVHRSVIPRSRRFGRDLKRAFQLEADFAAQPSCHRRRQRVSHRSHTENFPIEQYRNWTDLKWRKQEEYASGCLGPVQPFALRCFVELLEFAAKKQADPGSWFWGGGLCPSEIGESSAARVI